MSTQSTWMTNWGIFIEQISDLYRVGLDDYAIVQRFAGQRVLWTGTLAEKCYSKDVAGVQMDMPTITVDLPNGHFANVNYLFLNLRGDELLLWQDIEVGTTLRFATQISQWLTPFPAIRCWNDEENGNDMESVIMFSTDGAIPFPE